MNGEMMLKVMLAIGQTFVFFAVGAAAVKCKYLDSRDVSRLGNFTMDFIFPFCCFASVFNGMQGADPMAVWMPPVLGFAIMAFNGIIGLGLQYGLKNRSESRMRLAQKWLELFGASDDVEDGKHLLTFATTASLDSDAEERIAGPYCVEYVARQGRNGTALIRRERAFCGVDGDFPWTEAVLLMGLKDVEVKLCSVEHGDFDVPEEREWYRVGAILPEAVRMSLEYEGRDAESLLIPIYKRRGNVLK